MAKRHATDDEWDLFKDEIIDLYMMQDKSLKQVMESMTQQGFRRTKPQYERAFKVWGISKNVRKDEWKFIVDRLQDREAQNKASKVKVNGSLVPQSKIKKQRRLYETSTFQRFQSHHGKVPRPRTPSGVQIFTPGHSPMEVEAFNLSTVVEDNRVLWALHTPWKQFQDLISSITFPMWISRQEKRSGDASPSLSHLYLESSFISPLELIDLQHPGSLLEVTTVIELASKYGRDSFLQKALSRLPLGLDGISLINTNSAVQLWDNLTATQFMGLLIGALSNNFDIEQLTSLVIEMTEDRTYLTMLKDMLSQNIDTVSAFAEKLFFPALSAKRLELMEILVDSGVDINVRVSNDSFIEGRTALEYAVEGNHRGLLAFLLENGAADWTAIIEHEEVDVILFQGTVIDLAIYNNNRDFVEILLKYKSTHAGISSGATLDTLRYALYLGCTDIARMLLGDCYGLLEAAKAAPWFLYEAAACFDFQDMDYWHSVIPMLREKGIDITATDTFGCGSMLAVMAGKISAYDMSRVDIQALLDLGVAINGVVAGPPEPNNGYPVDEYLKRIRGMSALHVSILEQDEHFVKLILDHGCDPNQLCGFYPIQAAAKEGLQGIVNLLIDSGADFNATIHHEYDAILVSESLSSVYAIHLALMKGYVKIAESLHAAGATYKWSSATQPKPVLRNAILTALFTEGSRDFVSDAVQHWIIAEDFNARYIDICQWRFGIDFIDQSIGVDLVARNANIRLADMCRSAQDNLKDLPLNLKVAEFKHQIGGFSRDHGTRALTMAARAFSLSTIQILLYAGLSPFEPIPYPKDKDLGDLDMHYGLKKGQSTFECAFLEASRWPRTPDARIVVDLLLTWPSHHSLRHQQLCTAFNRAFCEDTSEMENLLGDHGICSESVSQALSANYLEDEFSAALVTSVSMGRYSLMDRILSKTSSFEDLINHPPPYEANTPLQIVVSQNKSSLVQRFLDLGAYVNAEPQTVGGATALQFAAIEGNFEILNILLAAGANIDAPPGAVHGRTALEGAAEWGRLDMVQYLLEGGADIQDSRNYRRTVYRAWKNGYHTVARKVQRYKLEKYPDQECESPQAVLDNMTVEELCFADDVSKKQYRRRHRGECLGPFI